MADAPPGNDSAQVSKHYPQRRGTRPTLVGIELMHMIKKRQLGLEEGEEGLTAAEQFYTLAA